MQRLIDFFLIELIGRKWVVGSSSFQKGRPFLGHWSPDTSVRGTLSLCESEGRVRRLNRELVNDGPS